MSDAVNESVECGNCGFVFHGEEVGKHPGEHKPCPNCGSLRRNIRLTVKETLALSEYIKIKAKKVSSKHKQHRADHEFEEGKRIGKDGRLVYKKSIKDREHTTSPHSYIERVIDIETGEIIVDKDEKLSEHTGGEVDKNLNTKG